MLGRLETEARERSWSLEAQGKLPVGFTAKHYPLTPAELRELKLLKNAAAAANGDADVYVALARGRTVDESRLNPKMVAYVKRHGRT